MDANNNLDSENQPDENLSDQEDQNQVQLTTITDLDLLVSSDSTNDTTETAVLPTKKEVESRLVSLSGQVERSYGHLQRSQDRSTKTSRASVYNIKSNRVCSRPLPTCGGGLFSRQKPPRIPERGTREASLFSLLAGPLPVGRTRLAPEGLPCPRALLSAMFEAQ